MIATVCCPTTQFGLTMRFFVIAGLRPFQTKTGKSVFSASRSVKVCLFPAPILYCSDQRVAPSWPHPV